MANNEETKVTEAEELTEVAETEVLADEAEAVEEVAAAESADTAAEVPGPTKGEKFAAAAKERWRKFLVSLKRNPQRIPLVFMVIVSAIWLMWLFTFSKSAANLAIDFGGITVFVNTLLSVLVLALFFNAFPKRKKPNVVMITLLFVFIAAMIAMDILYYINTSHFIYGYTDSKGVWHDPGLNAAGLASAPYAPQSLTYSIAHIALQGASAVVLALYPVYKRLLLKINTKKEVESNDIKEQIDLEDE